MLMQSAQTMKSDYIPDIREIVQILWRHRTLLALIMAVTLVLGTGIVLLLPKNYKAVSSVMLDDRTPDLSEDFHDVTAGAKFDDMTMQTEVKLLTSPALEMQTIKATGLDKVPEFASSTNDPQEVLLNFSKHLYIDPQGLSRVIEVSFKAHDPELAAKIANAHVQSYLDSKVELKKQQTAQLAQWFEGRVRDLKADVLKKSRAVEDFRARANLTIGKDDKELIYQQISDTAAELVPIEAHKYDVQSRLDALNAPGKSKQSEALTDIVSSTLIQNLKTQASTAAQEVQSLRMQYGPNYPKLIAAQGELDAADRAISHEVANIKNSLKNDAIATTAQEATLNGRLEALKKQSDDLREKMVTLNSLQIEEDASQKLLDTFLSDSQNVQSQMDFARPDAVMISQATTPSLPAAPGKKLLMLIVAVFSACLASGVVFTIELMRDGLKNFDDVRRLHQRPLGIIPLTANPAHALMGGRNFGYSEAIKRIYMSGIMNSNARSILVTSALPKEGRTTFTVSMAHYMRSLGHKVIVIDADFMNPALSALTSSAAGPGLADVLAGRATFAEAIETGSNGLAVMHSGNQALSTPDMLQSGKLEDLLIQLRQRYDYILIDSCPLLAHSEAGVIAGQADGIIVVAEWLKTSQQNIFNMFETLKQSSTPILGVVITKVNIDKYKTVSTGSDFLLPKAANAA